ncbi:protein-L-isoaspartate(D-aspartate) O-methyltransferase [Bacteroidota bacterium]
MADKKLEAARARLIEYLSQQIKDRRVLDALAHVPRELFIPPESQHLAYEDGPLPIGYGQTISQPFIVALMCQALELTGQERVLEVGAGSGYQAAILAKLARQVIAVERLAPLAERAGRVLDSLGYSNIVIHQAKKDLGWPEDAPYDAIIVAAGAPTVPPELLAQLAIGGRMVIPVGSRYIQQLYRVTRHRDKNEVENLGGCCFVSLIGSGAWEEDK